MLLNYVKHHLKNVQSENQGFDSEALRFHNNF